MKMSTRSLNQSSFIPDNSNLKQLIQPIEFIISHYNDSKKPFAHYTHKNQSWKTAPFMPQHYEIRFQELTSVKYLAFQNFTHGSQITVSVAQYPQGEFTKVYNQKFMVQGKILKKNLKMIDLGALPCRAIRLLVSKGAPVCSKNLSILGTKSCKIEQKLGQQYYKLLVINPMKIIYKD